MGRGQAPSPYPTSLKSFYFKKKMIMCASWRGGASSKWNCIGTSNAKKRDLYCVFLTMEMNERGYKITGPTEMHYAVIPMGTSKVNSSTLSTCLFTSASVQMHQKHENWQRKPVNSVDTAFCCTSDLYDSWPNIRFRASSVSSCFWLHLVGVLKVWVS